MIQSCRRTGAVRIRRAARTHAARATHLVVLGVIAALFVPPVAAFAEDGSSADAFFPADSRPDVRVDEPITQFRLLANGVLDLLDGRIVTPEADVVSSDRILRPDGVRYSPRHGLRFYPGGVVIDGDDILYARFSSPTAGEQTVMLHPDDTVDFANFGIRVLPDNRVVDRDGNPAPGQVNVTDDGTRELPLGVRILPGRILEMPDDGRHVLPDGRTYYPPGSKRKPMRGERLDKDRYVVSTRQPVSLTAEESRVIEERVEVTKLGEVRDRESGEALAPKGGGIYRIPPRTPTAPVPPPTAVQERTPVVTAQLTDLLSSARAQRQAVEEDAVLGKFLPAFTVEQPTASRRLLRQAADLAGVDEPEGDDAVLARRADRELVPLLVELAKRRDRVAPEDHATFDQKAVERIRETLVRPPVQRTKKLPALRPLVDDVPKALKELRQRAWVDRDALEAEVARVAELDEPTEADAPLSVDLARRALALAGRDPHQPLDVARVTESVDLVLAPALVRMWKEHQEIDDAPLQPPTPLRDSGQQRRVELKQLNDAHHVEIWRVAIRQLDRPEVSGPVEYTGPPVEDPPPFISYYATVPPDGSPRAGSTSYTWQEIQRMVGSSDRRALEKLHYELVVDMYRADRRLRIAYQEYDEALAATLDPNREASPEVDDDESRESELLQLARDEMRLAELGQSESRRDLKRFEQEAGSLVTRRAVPPEGELLEAWESQLAPHVIAADDGAADEGATRRADAEAAGVAVREAPPEPEREPGPEHSASTIVEPVGPQGPAGGTCSDGPFGSVGGTVNASSGPCAPQGSGGAALGQACTDGGLLAGGAGSINASAGPCAPQGLRTGGTGGACLGGATGMGQVLGTRSVSSWCGFDASGVGIGPGVGGGSTCTAPSANRSATSIECDPLLGGGPGIACPEAPDAGVNASTLCPTETHQRADTEDSPAAPVEPAPLPDQVAAVEPVLQARPEDGEPGRALIEDDEPDPDTNLRSEDPAHTAVAEPVESVPGPTGPVVLVEDEPDWRVTAGWTETEIYDDDQDRLAQAQVEANGHTPECTAQCATAVAEPEPEPAKPVFNGLGSGRIQPVDPKLARPVTPAAETDDPGSITFIPGGPGILLE